MTSDLEPCRECGTYIEANSDPCPSCGIADPQMKHLAQPSGSSTSNSLFNWPRDDSNLGKYLKFSAIALGFVVVVVIIALFARRMLYLNVWSYLSNKMVSGWNINRDLAKAIAGIIWIPFFYFFVASLSLRKSRRYLGLAGLSLYASSFFAIAWAANKDTHFSPDHGRSWVAFTPDGCKYDDEPGVDLVYGRQRVRVTPAIVDACTMMEKGEDPCYETLDSLPLSFLFNPSTNDPLVWYTRDNQGQYCYYLSPGFDTSTGMRRTPLTPSALERIREETHRRSEKEAKERAEAEARRAAYQDSIRRHQEQLRAEREKRQRIEARRSYWNQYVYVDALLASQSRPAVFIAVRENQDRPSVGFEEDLSSKLGASGVRALRFLRTEGYARAFSQIKNGTGRFIEEIGIAASGNHFLMLDIRMTPIRRSSVSNTEVFETEVEVSGRLISFDRGTSKPISIQSRGAGFHKNAAVRQAHTRSIERLVSEIT